jgi:CheY-like chemotaxis protein
MTMQAKQILVVEDDRFLHRACAASPHQRGWTVLTAVDGEEALAMTRRETRRPGSARYADAEAARLKVMRTLKAEEKTRAIPVLILSNSSRKQDVQEIMQLGAVGYLVKANLSL